MRAHPDSTAAERTWADPPAAVRLAVSLAVGVCVALALALLAEGQVAPVLGWDASATVFTAWIWSTIWRLDPDQTAAHAKREDPGRVAADVVLLSASVASLAAVGVLLVDGANRHSTLGEVYSGLGIVSVVLGWGMVHTLFTLRYARLYYRQPHGGIDFNEHQPPRYIDFAYLAFTVGMTFQVSDTDLKTKDIRATVLRHALLSYLFGAVIIATMINLVAGLSTK